MRLLILLLPAAAAALVTFALTPLTRRLAFAVGAVDHPAPRKIHLHPVPRLGGLAVIAATAAALSALYLLGLVDAELLSTGLLPGLALGVLPILFISVWDDIRPLSPPPKLLAHLIGATIAVVGFGNHLAPTVHLFGEEIHVGWLAMPISILWIAGVTNAFNLIDGLDGLSAGLALISSLSLAGVCLLESTYGPASIALILAGALIGFLPFNAYPARIFLGDSGAAAIGFTLGCIAVGGVSYRVSAGTAILIPIVVLGLPVADTFLSLCRRVVRRISGSGISIFQADRQHIHHRLLDLGLDHKRAVLVLYVIGLVLSGCAIGSMFLTSRAAALLLLTLLAASFVGISRLGYDEFALIRRGVALKYYDNPVLRMSLFAVFVDLAMTVVALYVSLVLKFDDWGVTATRPLASQMLSLFPAITLIVFCAFRIYWRTWRNAGMADLLRNSWAVVATALASYVICRWTLEDSPPVTFFMTYALVLLAGVNGARGSYRLVHEWTRRTATERSEGLPVAIYPAGGRGAMALENLLSNNLSGMKPVGFIDDDLQKSGKFVKGFPVFGGLASLPDLIEKQRIKGVIVASSRIAPERLQSLTEICQLGAIPLLSFNVEFRVEELQPVSGPVEEQLEMVPVIEPSVFRAPTSDLSH